MRILTLKMFVCIIDIKQTYNIWFTVSALTFNY